MTQRDFNLKEKILEYKKRSPVVFTQVLLGLGFCFNSNLKYNYIHVFRKKEYYRLLSSFVVFGDGFSQSLRNGFSVLGNAGLEISINNTKSFVKLQMLGILGILAMEVLLSQEYKREFKVLGILLDLTMKWVYYFRHSSTKVRILDQKLDTIFLVASKYLNSDISVYIFWIFYRWDQVLCKWSFCFLHDGC